MWNITHFGHINEKIAIWGNSDESPISLFIMAHLQIGFNVGT